MRHHYVLAIDPGDKLSGYAVIDTEDYKPISFGKVENELLRERMKQGYFGDVEATGEDEFCVAIEMVASYGMPVGREVFETCLWIGRFYEIACTSKCGFARQYADPDLVYRKQVKLNLCGVTKAKDANIRQALIDRFASTPGGKGTKSNPDWFYGFSADAWAAYAVGVTWIDLLKLGDLL